MQGSTHALIGMMAALAITEPAAAPGAIVLGAIGGLLPDIDHPNSTVSRKLFLLRLLIFWIPHRTFTHSIWSALLMLLPALFIHPLLICLWAGYTLHIAADMMTFQGIPILYPLAGYHFFLLPRGFRVLTGGFKESVFRFGVLSLLIIWIYLKTSPFWLSVLKNPQLFDLFF